MLSPFPLFWWLGVNFINVLTCSFYAHRSQMRKKLLELTVFFSILGYAFIKAALKMLVNWPYGSFINDVTQLFHSPCYPFKVPRLVYKLMQTPSNNMTSYFYGFVLGCWFPNWCKREISRGTPADFHQFKIHTKIIKEKAFSQLTLGYANFLFFA